MVQKKILETLTFDDVLLVPGRSRVLPREVDTSTHFSKSIKLGIPIVSAFSPLLFFPYLIAFVIMLRTLRSRK